MTQLIEFQEYSQVISHIFFNLEYRIILLIKENFFSPLQGFTDQVPLSQKRTDERILITKFEKNL